MQGGAAGMEVGNIKSHPTELLGRGGLMWQDLNPNPGNSRKTSLIIHTGAVKTCMKSKMVSIHFPS